MNEPDVPVDSLAPPSCFRKRKYLLFSWLVILLFLAFPVLLYFRQTWADADELQQELAETDGLDPRWRLDELEAKRKVVPDKKNAALRVLVASKLLPKNWDSAPSGVEPLDLDGFDPPVLLNDAQTAALRAKLKKVAPALRTARKLKDFPNGRYTIKWSPDYLSTQVPHVDQIGQTVRLLVYDARLRAQDKDADGACVSSQAALNAGRSLGDEPVMLSQLVRRDSQRLTVRLLERVLAQGEPSDNLLTDIQKLLADEARQRLLLIGLRGERAGLHLLMENAEAHRIDLGQLSERHGKRALIQKVTAFFSGDTLRRNHIVIFRRMNQAVEIAKLPQERQEEPFEELTAALFEAPPLARELLPTSINMNKAFRTVNAELCCAFTAVAVERYRLARGRWPRTLPDLTRAQLPKIPTDPFDGKSLRYRRLADGVVVYSVGPDGADDGGNIDRREHPADGTDVGFRLWDVAKRRQPPPPRKPPEGPPHCPLPPPDHRK